jgi:hypothetical protein
VDLDCACPSPLLVIASVALLERPFSEMLCAGGSPATRPSEKVNEQSLPIDFQTVLSGPGLRAVGALAQE